MIRTQLSSINRRSTPSCRHDVCVCVCVYVCACVCAHMRSPPLHPSYWRERWCERRSKRRSKRSAPSRQSDPRAAWPPPASWREIYRHPAQSPARFARSPAKNSSHFCHFLVFHPLKKTFGRESPAKPSNLPPKQADFA
jgi:hypothetical protein